MRYALYVLIMSVFLLAACGGGGDDNSNNNDNSNSNTDSGLSGEQLLATVQAEQAQQNQSNTSSQSSLPSETPEPTRDTSELQGETTGGDATIEPFIVPPVGVLGEAATEDPNPGEPQDTRTDFDYIYFEQIRLGDTVAERETLIIQITSDGRVEINTDPPTIINVSQAELAAVAQLINEVDFFNMQSTFLSGVPQPAGTYRYRMAVVRGDLQRAVQGEDNSLPPEIARLFGAVRSLADDIPNPFPQASSTEVGG